MREPRASPLDDRAVAPLLGQRRERRLIGAPPAQVVQRLRERRVGAQRRELPEQERVGAMRAKLAASAAAPRTGTRHTAASAGIASIFS